MASMTVDHSHDLDFMALGGVWLDDIHQADGKVLKNVPGGSVTFATLGARLFAAQNPSKIGLVIRAGSDFPNPVLDTLRAWHVAFSILREPDRPSAKGIIHYGNVDGPRAYKRLTDPLNVTLSDLLAVGFSFPRAMHLFETPAGLLIHLEAVRDRANSRMPIVVWEPQVRACQPTTRDEHVQAAHSVDVFSPNHGELARLFEHQEQTTFDRSTVEGHAKVFVDAGIGSGGNGCIVVRAGEYGCMVASRDRSPVWLPTCHESTSDKVINTTGAGNAFLGGFAVGYLETGSFVDAASYGQVTASFAIEQVGLPSLDFDDGGTEMWNGSEVRERLRVYQTKLDAAGIS